MESNLIKVLIDDKNISNIYKFGSIVYESNDKDSDEDFIIIVNDLAKVNHVIKNDINIHVYSEEEYSQLLNNHEIQMLECYFLPVRHIIKETYFPNFTLNLAKLRISISTISSNSFQKGKKKLIILGDYDLRAGIKSAYHAIRILDYGIQIALHKRIVNFTKMNYVLADIKKMHISGLDHLNLWEAIDTKYRKLFNSKSSEFKALAPKDLTEQNRKILLTNILKSHNIEVTDQLIFDILELVNK